MFAVWWLGVHLYDHPEAIPACCPSRLTGWGWLSVGSGAANGSGHPQHTSLAYTSEYYLRSIAGNLQLKGNLICIFLLSSYNECIMWKCKLPAVNTMLKLINQLYKLNWYVLWLHWILSFWQLTACDENFLSKRQHLLFNVPKVLF